MAVKLAEDAYVADQRPTRPIPRPSLPPIGPAPPTEDEMANEPVTMLECPACAGCSACKGRHFVPCTACPEHYVQCAWCRACSYCNGSTMVTPARAAAWSPNDDPDAA